MLRPAGESPWLADGPAVRFLGVPYPTRMAVARRPRRLIMRLDGLVGPDGSTPREWRASWWRRAPARQALRTALDWAPHRLVIAHGVLPEEDGRDALAQGLRWLL